MKTMTNQNIQSRSPHNNFSSMYKIIYFSRLMSLEVLLGSLETSDLSIWMEHSASLSCYKHCWKWTFWRAQENEPKQKWHRLCRMLACLIKVFTWFPGVDGRVINMKFGTLGGTKRDIIPMERNSVCSQDTVNIFFIVSFPSASSSWSKIITLMLCISLPWSSDSYRWLGQLPKF